MRCLRLLPALLCATVAVHLGGCVEVDEHWTFDATGGGTYGLEIAYDADLWRRASRALGPKGTRALVRRAAVPLSVAHVRDGLAGLEGVTITALTDGVGADGRRALSLRVAFTSLAGLLKWEVLARRTVHLAVERDGPGEDAARTARLVMDPVRRVPILDEVVRLQRQVQQAAGNPPRPDSLRRVLGLDPTRSALIWNMVKVSLQKTVIRIRVDTPGDLKAQDGRPTTDATSSATFTFDWQRLQATPVDRAISLAWQMSELDALPPVRHRSPAPR